MYLRRTTRRVGDKTYQNYLLVESVATPKGPRQRVICSLGTLAPGPKDAWLGTAQRLQAALAGQTALVPDATVAALAGRARPPRYMRDEHRLSARETGPRASPLTQSMSERSTPVRAQAST